MDLGRATSSVDHTHQTYDLQELLLGAAVLTLECVSKIPWGGGAWENTRSWAHSQSV